MASTPGKRETTVAQTKMSLKATKLPADEYALTNNVYINPEDYKTLKPGLSSNGDYVLIKDFVFTLG